MFPFSSFFVVACSVFDENSSGPFSGIVSTDETGTQIGVMGKEDGD